MMLSATGGTAADEQQQMMRQALRERDHRRSPSPQQPVHLPALGARSPSPDFYHTQQQQQQQQRGRSVSPGAAGSSSTLPSLSPVPRDAQQTHSRSNSPALLLTPQDVAPDARTRKRRGGDKHTDKSGSGGGVGVMWWEGRTGVPDIDAEAQTQLAIVNDFLKRAEDRRHARAEGAAALQ